MANSVDSDQTPRSAASDLTLHCLRLTACRSTWHKYGKNYLLLNQMINLKCIFVVFFFFFVVVIVFVFLFLYQFSRRTCLYFTI